MVRKLIASALLLAVVALAGGAGASAQTGPGVKPPVVTPPVAPPVVVKGLSEADLLKALRTLDPNVRVRQITNGTVYNLKVSRDGWQYELRVTSFANDVWVDVYLGTPISLQKVSAPLLAELLAKNFDSPATFSFVKQADGRVQLLLSRLAKRGPLTSQGLQFVISATCQRARVTYMTWDAILIAAK
jgi:hypothetical protein